MTPAHRKAMREATGVNEVAILSMYAIINHLNNSILNDQNRQNAAQ